MEKGFRKLYASLTCARVYMCRSSKCISSEFVCDGEEDCPESDDEAECIGFITPAKKKYVYLLCIETADVIIIFIIIICWA